MTDQPGNPDYEALARRYLDLWQEQIAKLAREPNTLGDTAAAWSQMAANFLQQAGGVKGHDHARPTTAHPATAHSTTDRAAPAAAPHGDGGLDFAGLLRRVDELEQRIAQLEAERKPAARSGTRARRGSSGPKP